MRSERNSAERVGSESLLNFGLLACLAPMLGREVEDAARGPLGEQTEEVAQVVCTSCGGALQEWAGQFEESTEIDLLERRFVQLRHKRKKYRCARGGCVETAPAPLKLMPGGRYSIDFAISTAVAKYGDHMPLERLARALARHGLKVDSQTLWDQINALARVLSPAHVHCMRTC